MRQAHSEIAVVASISAISVGGRWKRALISASRAAAGTLMFMKSHQTLLWIMDDPQDLRHRKGVFGTTKWRVNGLPILIEEGADGKIRRRKQFFLYEKQGDNHPTKAAIPVQKWMKCLELGVNDSELD